MKTHVLSANWESGISSAGGASDTERIATVRQQSSYISIGQVGRDNFGAAAR